MAVVDFSNSPVGGSDPAGSGVDMAQWQNWIKMMLGQQQPQPAPAPAQQQPPYIPSAQGGMPFPQNPGPAASNMPYPGQIDPRGYFAPRAGGPSAPGSSPAATTTAPPAAPRSVAPTPDGRTPGAPNLGYYPPNPRFGTMQSQVPSGRGPLGNNPIYTTMNLFGGGQPAAATPAAAAATPPPTGSSPGMRIVNGPSAAPPGRTQMDPTALAGAVSMPNWWQNLGRPDMNPDQLASAVRKPNWYRNV
jgi:hypothetical protein